jgi:aspartate racemase
MTFLLGVLGGMGPLATVDFLAKLCAATPANGDADHVPHVTVSIPQIPSRVAAILRGGESPLPALLDARDRLRAAGATHYAMACNTAYHWVDTLREGLDAPFLHIADAAVDEVATQVPAGARVGVIATEATHAIGLYPQRLERAGFPVATPSAADNARVVEGIAAVKRGDAAGGGRRFAEVVDALAAAGCRAVVLGCTEVPPGLEAAGVRPAVPAIDPTGALARACVGAWTASRVNGADRPGGGVARPGGLDRIPAPR